MTSPELHRLKPEVAGGTGDGTVITNYDALRAGTALVPEVTELEYTFDDWLGDDILESFPCFVATEALIGSLEAAGLTGLATRPVTVSVSELWEQIHEDDDPTGSSLPPFRWLTPTGGVHVELGEVAYRGWSGDDLCVSQRAELVVSDRALAVLRRHHLENCDVERLEAGETIE